YDNDKPHFLLGEFFDDEKTQDVPRNKNGRAIIADLRNDENVIVCQLHTMFMRFHNCSASPESDFASVQKSVRWNYQWMILDDFLRRIINEKTYNDVLPHDKKKTDVLRDPPNLRF